MNDTCKYCDSEIFEPNLVICDRCNALACYSDAWKAWSGCRPRGVDFDGVPTAQIWAECDRLYGWADEEAERFREWEEHLDAIEAEADEYERRMFELPADRFEDMAEQANVPDLAVWSAVKRSAGFWRRVTPGAARQIAKRATTKAARRAA